MDNSTTNPVSEEDDGGTDEFLQRLLRNRRLNDYIFYPLLVAYVLLIVFGVLANILIVVLVLRQRSNKNQLRHWLMINLSLSDLLLCLVTMPLTLMELVCYSWPLGNYPLLCKLAGSLEAVSIYCSTLTIASIAVDRYHLIVQPVANHRSRRNQPQSSSWWSLLQLCCIWIASGALACPLFLFRTLSHNPLPGETEKLLGISSVDYCFEDWPAPYWSLAYSIGSSVFQFIIPVIVIILTHASICARLSRRFRHNNPRNKTQQLLVAIAATFVSCWLPLNLFNLIDSAGVLPSTANDRWQHEVKLIIYALCHLAGMSSACINPVLYGWLNQNLRADLVRLFPRLVRSVNNKTSSNNQTQQVTTCV